MHIHMDDEQKLRRDWTSQLYKEHEHICWQHRVRLKKPVIEIGDARDTWGSWDAASQTIRISARLIIAHAWDVTVNILKHEMAHQLVTEIFCTQDSHGPMFQDACRLLGVPDVFRHAQGDMPAILDMCSDEGSARVRIFDRVKKLLALAQSANEYEAALAMQKANELIARHNLERIGHDEPATYVYRIISPGKKRIAAYQRHICTILMNYFFVEVVFSDMYDPAACETYKTIEILGAAENVEIAEYVYYFLLRQLDRLWREYRGGAGKPAKGKISYRLGVLHGLGEKLKASEAARRPEARNGKRSPTVSSLVCQQDTKLAEFLRARFPRLARVHSKSSLVDQLAYLSGVREGRKLTIHKGISSQEGYGGKLLQS